MARSITFRNADDLFTQLSVGEVEKVLERTNKLADQKRMELKELVSSRYHDLIDSADAIVGMTDTVEQFKDTVKGVETDSDQLFSQRLNFLKLSKQAADNAHDAAHTAELPEAPRAPPTRQISADMSQAQLDVLDADMANLLMALPSKIWAAIDGRALWHATLLFKSASSVRDFFVSGLSPPCEELAHHTSNPALQSSALGIGAELSERLSHLCAQRQCGAPPPEECSLWDRFPLLRSQFNLTMECKEQIIARAHQVIASPSVSEQMCASAVASLVLLHVTTAEESLDEILTCRGDQLGRFLKQGLALLAKVSSEEEKKSLTASRDLSEARQLNTDLPGVDDTTTGTANGTESSRTSRLVRTILVAVLKTIHQTIVHVMFTYMSNPSASDLEHRALIGQLTTMSAAKAQDTFVEGNAKFEADLEAIQKLGVDPFSVSPATSVDLQQIHALAVRKLQHWVGEQRDAVREGLGVLTHHLTSIDKLRSVQDHIEGLELQWHTEVVGSTQTQPEQPPKLRRLDEAFYFGTLNDTFATQQRNHNNEPQQWLCEYLLGDTFMSRASNLMLSGFESARVRMEKLVRDHISTIGAAAQPRLKRALGMCRKNPMLSTRRPNLAQAQDGDRARGPLDFPSSRRNDRRLMAYCVKPSLPIQSATKRVEVALSILACLDEALVSIARDACRTKKPSDGSEGLASDNASLRELLEDSANQQLAKVLGDRCVEFMTGFLQHLEASVKQAQDHHEDDGDGQDTLLQRTFARQVVFEESLLVGRVAEALSSSAAVRLMVGDAARLENVVSSFTSLSSRLTESTIHLMVDEIVGAAGEELGAEPWHTVTSEFWQATHPGWVTHTMKDDSPDDEEEDNIIEDEDVLIPSTASTTVYQFCFELCEILQRLGDARFINKFRVAQSSVGHDPKSTSGLLDSRDRALDMFETTSENATRLLSRYAAENFVACVTTRVLECQPEGKTICEAAALQLVYDLKYFEWQFSASCDAAALGKVRELTESVVADNFDAVLWCLYEQALESVLPDFEASCTLLMGATLLVPQESRSRDQHVLKKQDSASLSKRVTPGGQYMAMVTPIPRINSLPVATPFKPLTNQRLRKNASSARRSSRPSTGDGKTARRPSKADNSANTTTSDVLRDKAYAAMESVGTNIFSQASQWLQKGE